MEIQILRQSLHNLLMSKQVEGIILISEKNDDQAIDEIKNFNIHIYM